MGQIVDLEEIRRRRALESEVESTAWDSLLAAVARDVVEHLPDVLPWRAAPTMLRITREELYDVALQGRLAIARVDGELCILSRRSEGCLIELLSGRLALPATVQPRRDEGESRPEPPGLSRPVASIDRAVDGGGR
ncbi:hypothetical protein [Gryllotalpicola ginsengisoli]|uniref:hypothetical protein n=1 Tax=Gryllotalpicola ginsengisoli TaxID=444608 RepID=UPI0003B3B7C9|nr:hypothetical protein [Gryllotalpicola ginsengisoli]